MHQFCFLHIQLWARAYRNQMYHATINTTNGVESQNKLLKYSYLATPNFVLPPGVTVPRSLVPISAPSSTLTDVESFSMIQCRLAHDVLPDGNCMFRALSHQLYGSDQHHVHVRSMLLEVIESNKIIYQPYWIKDTPWGTTFNEHLQRVALVGSWGTQVELQAVSDCFNVTVFVCSPNPSGIVRWEKKATPKNHDNINIPAKSLQATLLFTQSY